MEFEKFKSTINSSVPPDVSDYLKALWYDAKGDWENAHNIVQDTTDVTGSWVHAYLHRKEGDEGNALYWYSRAKKQKPSYSLEKEWEEIVRALLN